MQSTGPPSSDCPHRAKGDKQGKGSKGSKGAEKGSKGEKGKKGDSKGGKPKGKRATEFSSFQPESEAGSEWSEPDIEDGGRLSVLVDFCEPFFICESQDMHAPHLWLVDSGASKTVISIESLSAYRVLRE